ncbi:MAG: transglutaminase domain-containing protein [Candidatus Hydrogenedentes bacterium]|nr:transglutaminase domain-containing protein [Candidatus Hydrogenedentota bacterium]
MQHRTSIALLCILGAAIPTVADESSGPKSCRAKLVYSCAITDVPEGAATIDLWMPAPSDARGQVVHSAKVNYPAGGAIATEQVYSNRIFHARFTAPFDPESLRAELEFEIERTEVVVPEATTMTVSGAVADTAALAPYLAPNRLIPVDGRIDALAKELNLDSSNPIKIARFLYDHLIDSMAYNWKAVGAGKGDVLWACDSKTGDCTDYNSLFLALCRNQGIPADHGFGFPIKGTQKSGIIPFYHCWAQFYVEGAGWIPIDPSEADKHPELRDYNFGSQDARLMKFSHGRDIVLVPPQQGEPINYFIHPYVEVDGKPSQAFKRTMTYEILAETK